MAEITIFELAFCPYCRKARKALKALAEEDPAYAGVKVRWIDENRQRALADRYDYWYVPSVYQGERKLYEADPSQGYEEIKASLKAALDQALEGET